MKNLIKLFLIIVTVFSFLPVLNFAQSGEIKKAENFTLKDFNGKTHSLSDYKNSKAIVIMFISTECPISNAYNTRMVKIYNQFKNKDVVFLAINSNKQENSEIIKKHADQNRFEFTILKDNENKIADKFNATVTPEIFILNNNLDVLYHGRIDDSRKEESVTQNDLENALNEVLQGRKVQTPVTKAFGCTIKRING